METQNLAPEHHLRILELHQQGLSQTKIAALLGLSRRTVYNHVHLRVFQPGRHRGRPRGSRKLQPFEAYVLAYRRDFPSGNLQDLLAVIRSHGYTGGVSILREFCRQRREDRVVEHREIQKIQELSYRR